MKKLITTFGALVLMAFLAVPLSAQDPYETPDDAWISLTGTVQGVSQDRFVLKFDDEGVNLITVEMDDGDRDADAYKLLPGDTVTVYGVVDNDLFENRTIEASSVYVANLGTYFYASPRDEEDDPFVILSPPIVSGTVVQGTVTEVNDEEFKLNTGLREITVEVEEMAYNPLDDTGYQKVRVGDRVSVTGRFDMDFLEGRELVAETIVTLSGDS